MRKCVRISRSGSVVAAVALNVGAAGQTIAGVNYTAHILYQLLPLPQTSFPSESANQNFFNDANGQVVGVSGSNFQYTQASLWNSPSGTVVNLTPGGFANSVAESTNGTQQVGFGYNGPQDGPDYQPNAMLWTNTAASAVDLNPAGYAGSEAYGIYGNNQVGEADGNAALWSGSAASFVDLNPSGFANSVAYGADATQQVGAGNNDGSEHALLWTGSATSAVDLNPAGFANSEATGVSGNQQVGIAYESPTSSPILAMLWTGTAASAVNLNPAGFAISTAFATNGSQQIGWGVTTGSPGVWEALLWSGTAASAENLGSVLPSNNTWILSQALSFDAAGNIYGLAEDSRDNQYAVVWSPVPEPATGSLLLMAGAGMVMRRRRRPLA
ncbi:MAG TPA: PEP-CTERM sorting domain-containing protein [Tepidisphaeraceae bacterium]|nr:PEP-CTERM sorting domain-containing protein [Tepidisphaeraceae bacterium]